MKNENNLRISYKLGHLTAFLIILECFSCAKNIDSAANKAYLAVTHVAQIVQACLSTSMEKT